MIVIYIYIYTRFNEYHRDLFLFPQRRIHPIQIIKRSLVLFDSNRSLKKHDLPLLSFTAFDDNAQRNSFRLEFHRSEGKGVQLIEGYHRGWNDE